MACLFSSYLLFRTRYVRYLMAFWCSSFMRFLILDFGILRLVSIVMACSWIRAHMNILFIVKLKILCLFNGHIDPSQFS